MGWDLMNITMRLIAKGKYWLAFQQHNNDYVGRAEVESEML